MIVLLPKAMGTGILINDDSNVNWYTIDFEAKDEALRALEHTRVGIVY